MRLFHLEKQPRRSGCFLFLKCSGIEYVDGVKDYSNYSPDPLIILPLIAGLYGIYLIIRKGFRLAKQFETAED